MKKKSLKMAIIIALSGTLFSLSSCSKPEFELAQNIEINTLGKMKVSPIVYALPEKVPSISYGLKVRAKESIKRLYKSPKDLDKMTAILKGEEKNRIEVNRKVASSKNALPSVKSIMFTASDYGTYYVCYAEANQPGPL